MKKLCIFMLVSLLFIWLTSCGTSTNGPGTSSPASDTPVASTTEPTAEPTVPSSSVEDPLPPLGETDILPSDESNDRLKISRQYEDLSGYKYEVTYTFSPWMRDDDDSLQDLWSETSNEIAFPDHSLYIDIPEDVDHYFYSIGTASIQNITEGWDIIINHLNIELGTSAIYRINMLVPTVTDNSEVKWTILYTGSSTQIGFRQRNSSNPTIELTDGTFPFIIVLGVYEEAPTPNFPDGKLDQNPESIYFALGYKNEDFYMLYNYRTGKNTSLDGYEIFTLPVKE